MNIEDFKHEAERLAREAVLLRDVGDGSPLAYWHGADTGELCISVAHAGRWLNVHLDEDSGGCVEPSASPRVSDIPLFGEKFLSLPPVDGVFVRGSDAVGAYLNRFDWPRTELYNDNFPDDVPGEYELIWQDNCPLYNSDIAAVLGGWHYSWPDGDWHDRIDHELVVWTFRDAEPWIEVFQDGGQFVVKQRIT